MCSQIGMVLNNGVHMMNVEMYKFLTADKELNLLHMMWMTGDYLLKLSSELPLHHGDL